MSEQPTIQKTPELNPFDLDQQRKRVASVLKTAEGRQALRDALLNTKEGTEIVKKEFGIAIVHASAKDKPIVAILIPAHKKPENETGNALEKMIPVAREHAHIVMRPSIASSVVHWVRNQLVSQLYKEKMPFDYVLFMDDDMYPPPHALSTLLNRNVDIVGAVCTVRQDPPLPNVRHFTEEKFLFQTADIDQRGIWQVGAVGTGFLLISKKALDAIGEYTVQQRYAQKYFGISEELRAAREQAARKIANETGNYWWFEFLKHPLGDGEYGEDVSLCFKARECGFEIYADSSFSVGHLGNYPFSIEDYWAYREDAVKRGLVVSLDGRRAQPRIPVEKLPDDCKKISILCPTRGRPESIKRLATSISDTADDVTGVLGRLLLYIDDDDDASLEVAKAWDIRHIVGPRRTLSDYWNVLAKEADGDILFNCGDDVLFKTKGWDTLVKQTFAACPDRIMFVFGDDGHWGQEFGTHGFIHRKWLDAAGYFTPPYFSSDYGDTWLNEVALGLDRRVFIPIETEHLHPLWGKAVLDQTHKERLERHKQDGVDELYDQLFPKRQEDIEKLREVTNRLISVLIPSRGRPEQLIKSILALKETAATMELEIIVRLDDDDPRPELPRDVRVIVGERHGYKQLHRYYNEMAAVAKGKWMMLWNDDCLMRQAGWDAKLASIRPGLVVLNSRGQYNTFPIVHRSLYELLGHLSLQAHSDTWLQQISREVGIEIMLPLKIEHSSQEEQKQEKAYAETRPEYFSEANQALVMADVAKVRAALKPLCYTCKTRPVYGGNQCKICFESPVNDAAREPVPVG